MERNAITTPLGRRAFLAASLLGYVAVPRLLRADEEAASYPGMILRGHQPLNLEMPFPSLRSPITPTDRFFVRSHFAIPKVDVADWRLSCGGHVERELSLSLDQLRRMSSKTIECTIECAGNGRAFLTPPAKGLLWELGAVGNATWTGVPLSEILKQAGVKEDAVEVILEGSDKGEVSADPKSPGPIPFARSVPLAKARSGDVILAYQMNGEDLPSEHGFPLRAVVAGWYGMASIKWLARIIVTAEPFQGYWQTMSYSYWQRLSSAGNQPSLESTLRPVRGMQIKSQIARPAGQEVVKAGSTYLVHGAAWAGERTPTRIEFSADGGKSWQEAKWRSDPKPFAWRMWECEWKVPTEPGAHTLMSRATDDQGNVQPGSHDSFRQSYLINYTLPVSVRVR